MFLKRWGGDNGWKGILVAMERLKYQNILIDNNLRGIFSIMVERTLHNIIKSVETFGLS